MDANSWSMMSSLSVVLSLRQESRLSSWCRRVATPASFRLCGKLCVAADALFNAAIEATEAAPSAHHTQTREHQLQTQLLDTFHADATHDSDLETWRSLVQQEAAANNSCVHVGSLGELVILDNQENKICRWSHGRSTPKHGRSTSLPTLHHRKSIGCLMPYSCPSDLPPKAWGNIKRPKVRSSRRLSPNSPTPRPMLWVHATHTRA
ncbi:hypothetical protein M438DRAFT_169463 [Aureobasidium pullulans EXF-150]|uniref:Uncharacterized protein n=1 Tax=Aureobasidium pullulans EXF-150 TaxID=1043002 RepID=A0A074X4R2_AURPU|nr:uncharacterized protein M438DRAFT_169463 [Aureobasidium pullulans EXF-150]KEQ78754.1 hypothetical protein M438DRAFT_169463 [Aureobasidium pullulans EXF-150]